MADGRSKRHKSSHESPPASSVTCKTECKTEFISPASKALPSSQDDLTLEELESWGILRDFNPDAVVRSLIRTGKTGWELDPTKHSTENLHSALIRYTIGRGKPCTWTVKPVNTWPETYEATLETCLSEARYVGHGPSELLAKRAAANRFFEDGDVLEVFKWLPPTQSDIRAMCQVSGLERRQCQAYLISADLIAKVVHKRMGLVNEKFHQAGYHTDIWDGKT